MAFPVINFGQFIAICIIYIIVMGLIVWNNAAAWGSPGGFFGSLSTTIQISWWFFGVMAIWLVIGSVFVSKADRVNIRDWFDSGKPVLARGSFVQYNKGGDDW